MDDIVITSYVSSNGEECVQIVQRPDGLSSYRRRWFVDAAPGREWGAPGQNAGAYDSPEMAESEASARIPWLRNC